MENIGKALYSHAMNQHPPPGPCMRGKIDLDLYNRTKEVKYIEPLEEYIPPEGSNQLDAKAIVINPEKAPSQNFKRKRGWGTMAHPNKPTKEQLEADLQVAQSMAELTAKYKVHPSSIYNWIKEYELQGFKERAKTVVNTPEMVQESPSLEELEQVYPEDDIQESSEPDEVFSPDEDAHEKPWSDSEAEQYPEPTEATQADRCQEDPELDIVPDNQSRSFEKSWLNVRKELKALRSMYRIEADKEFSSKLREEFDSIIEE